MSEDKYCVINLGTHEIYWCDKFRPIWDALRYSIIECENPRLEVYENGAHISTIATAPNGRIYYRRIKSLKQYDITELFARFAQ